MAETTIAPPTPTPPPTKPAPSSQPHSSGETRFNDAFADIDEMMKESEPTSPPPPKEIVLPKPPEQNKTKPTEKTGDKPPDKLSAPKELRTAYEELKRKHAALEGELTTLKTTKPAEDPEKQTMTERLEQLQREREELANELKYSAYERSPEYKTRFLEPLERAFKTAYDDVAQLQITDSEGNALKASPDHLNALLRMSLPQAIAQSKEWFGDAAQEVLAMRRHIIELNEGRQQAVDQYRKEGGEREKTRSEQSTRQVQEIRGLWKQHVEEGIQKHVDLFKAADDDPKGKELLDRGMKLADVAFGSGGGMAPKDVVRLHAAIRNKAGGYDYQVYRNRQLTAKVKELETKLAELDASQPGEGSGKRGEKQTSQTWGQEIDALAQE